MHGIASSETRQWTKLPRQEDQFDTVAQVPLARGLKCSKTSAPRHHDLRPTAAHTSNLAASSYYY